MRANKQTLEALRVDPEAASRLADFFVNFAEVLMPDFGTDDEWAKPGAKASALRLAAQFTALSDVESAMVLLSRAAREYITIGLPYGYFLAASYHLETNANLFSSRSAAQLNFLASRESMDQNRLPPLEEAALGYPVQQVYLIMALLTDRNVWQETRSSLEYLTDAVAAHKAHPIGPQGVAITIYLDFAHALRGIHEDDRRARAAAIELLSTMAQSYAIRISEAQENSYLWSQLLSPLDIVDLELTGLVLAMAAALRDSALAPLRNDEVFIRHLQPLARVPFLLALDIMALNPSRFESSILRAEEIIIPELEPEPEPDQESVFDEPGYTQPTDAELDDSAT